MAIDFRKVLNPPDLSEVLDEHKRDIFWGLNCVQIGIIQSFDKETQTATVKIALKQVIKVDDKGVKTIREYPLLMTVPVFVLFGGNDFISMPIAQGDYCIILFNDREIDRWMENGEGQYPATARMHDLSDAIALVGINPLTHSISTYLANGIRLSHSSSSNQSKIDLTNALIEATSAMFKINGNMHVTGDLTVDGGGSSAQCKVNCNLYQSTGKSIHAGNGATGTFGTVTVVDGIVVGGS